MLFSHLVAVVITALVLRRGEELVLGIRTRLGSVFAIRFGDVQLPALTPVVVRAVVRPTSLRNLPVLAGAVTRRGPPLMLAVGLFA